jgi:hypothetical protein
MDSKHCMRIAICYQDRLNLCDTVVRSHFNYCNMVYNTYYDIDETDSIIIQCMQNSFFAYRNESGTFLHEKS